MLYPRQHEHFVFSIHDDTKSIPEEEIAELEAQERAQAEARLRQAQFQHAAAAGYDTEDEVAAIERERHASVMGTAAAGTVVREAPKVGRNDPCPCGSGKKYKHCHGQLA